MNRMRARLAVAEAVVERLEPIQLLSNRLWNPRCSRPGDDLHILREEPQHPLLPKPAGERPHGGGMRVGFIRPLSRRPVGKEDDGPDDFVVPWRLVHKLQSELCEIFGWHLRGSPAPGIRHPSGGLIS